MKYITIDGYKMMIFDRSIRHKDFFKTTAQTGERCTGAGFIRLDGTTPVCHGEAESLGVRSDSERDDLLAGILFSASRPRVSKRAAAWREFAAVVEKHIEEYTVPQYGDEGEDQVTEFGAMDCLVQLKKYANRYGRNVRTGQEELDFVKMAHYVQLLARKHGGGK